MKQNYFIVVIILLVISCDNRKIIVIDPETNFTVRLYTSNITIPVNTKNPITIEIEGSRYDTYTMRFMTEGNGILYDDNMVQVEQNSEVATNDEFYFEPKITGNFKVVFEVKNNLGDTAQDELAFIVSE